MSDNIDLHALEYRSFVVSFANNLTAEEVYEVAYIWLSKYGDVSKYKPTSKPRICGLDVLATLECRRIFSRDNISGLVDIAKKINRYDLVDDVEAFIKKTKGSRHGMKHNIKKKESSLSEERQELQRTFETMVTQMAVLEQHISLLHKTLQKSDIEIIDDGMEIVQHSGDIAQALATNLNSAYKKLARRSRAESTTSGSSDGSRRSSREVGENTATPLTEGPKTAGVSSGGDFIPATSPAVQVSVTQQPYNEVSTQLVHPKREKPVPKPRSPKPVSKTAYGAPIQETPGQPSQLACPFKTNGNDSADPRLTSALKQSRVTRPINTSSPPTPRPRSTGIRNRSGAFIETAVEEEDWTGDSGMGTGSGTASYEAVFEWRQALKQPPPVKPKSEHFYTSLRGDLTDDDQVYQELDRGHS